MTKVTKKWNQLVLNIPYDNWNMVEIYLYQNQLYSFEKIDPRYEVDKEDFETWLYFDKSIFDTEYQGITVKIYTEEDDVEVISKVLKYIEDNNLGKGHISLIDESDWENNWKDHFDIEEIGDKLAIVPSWETYNNIDNRKIIKLDPGMAFGTGHHETTRLAMYYIEKYLQKDDHVLDIGTGSGILAITAGLLGASKIVGTDIDEESVEIAAKNAKINGVNADFIVTDLLNGIETRYDLVVSNIVAEIIMLILPELNRVLKNDGIFICSGIVDDKLLPITKAIEKNGYEVIDKLSENEWNSLVVRRRIDV